MNTHSTPFFSSLLPLPNSIPSIQVQKHSPSSFLSNITPVSFLWLTGSPLAPYSAPFFAIPHISSIVPADTRLSMLLRV